jgi:hypothetical protein
VRKRGGGWEERKRGRGANKRFEKIRGAMKRD